MHVNARRIAFLGLLLAVAVILLILGGTIEINTLFFLAGAAFCVGIAIREYGVGMGTAFFMASIILGLLLAPNKLYVVTYAAMAIYILLSEVAWNILSRTKKAVGGMKLFWVIRYVIFNAIYLPVIFLFPQLILSVDLTAYYYIVAIVAGQIILFLFEKAYCYFHVSIWNRFRKYLNS